MGAAVATHEWDPKLAWDFLLMLCFCSLCELQIPLSVRHSIGPGTPNSLHLTGRHLVVEERKAIFNRCAIASWSCYKVPWV